MKIKRDETSQALRKMMKAGKVCQSQENLAEGVTDEAFDALLKAVREFSAVVDIEFN